MQAQQRLRDRLPQSNIFSGQIFLEGELEGLEQIKHIFRANTFRGRARRIGADQTYFQGKYF